MHSDVKSATEACIRDEGGSLRRGQQDVTEMEMTVAAAEQGQFTVSVARGVMGRRVRQMKAQVRLWGRRARLSLWGLAPVPPRGRGEASR